MITALYNVINTKTQYKLSCKLLMKLVCGAKEYVKLNKCIKFSRPLRTLCVVPLFRYAVLYIRTTYMRAEYDSFSCSIGTPQKTFNLCCGSELGPNSVRVKCHDSVYTIRAV